MRTSSGLAKLTEVAAPQVSARQSSIGRSAIQIAPAGKALNFGFSDLSLRKRLARSEIPKLCPIIRTEDPVAFFRAGSSVAAGAR